MARKQKKLETGQQDKLGSSLVSHSPKVAQNTTMYQKDILKPGNFREMEDQIIARVDVKEKVLAIAEKLMPLLEGDATVGDVMKMMERSSPLAMMTLVDVVMNAKSDAVRARAATEVLYMAGYKPVEKSVNITETIDRMSGEQVDSFLLNAVNNMSIQQRDEIINLIRSPSGDFVPVTEGKLPEVSATDIPVEEY